jgi:hypothetical protein
MKIPTTLIEKPESAGRFKRNSAYRPLENVNRMAWFCVVIIAQG